MYNSFASIFSNFHPCCLRKILVKNNFKKKKNFQQNFFFFFDQLGVTHLPFSKNPNLGDFSETNSKTKPTLSPIFQSKCFSPFTLLFPVKSF